MTFCIMPNTNSQFPRISGQTPSAWCMLCDLDPFAVSRTSRTKRKTSEVDLIPELKSGISAGASALLLRNDERVLCAFRLVEVIPVKPAINPITEVTGSMIQVNVGEVSGEGSRENLDKSEHDVAQFDKRNQCKY